MEERERRARSHSLRVTLLDLLAKDGRELTASQIRAELPDGPTLGRVYYHLKVLVDNGLVVMEDGYYRRS
jgi:Fe2+ or Zn2+ uptake regulation protein